MYYNLHWLPINLRIRFKVLLFVFKAIHSIAPPYISDLISVKPNSSYNLRSSSAGILHAFPFRKTKRTLGDWLFSVAAPTLWNELPREFRDLEDFNSFKQKQKTHFFKLTHKIFIVFIIIFILYIYIDIFIYCNARMIILMECAQYK